MISYKGFEITPVSNGQHFWCGRDFDGGDIDYETPTQDPHGNGSIQECKAAIDEHLLDGAE